jgi:hypothetical protein
VKGDGELIPCADIIGCDSSRFLDAKVNLSEGDVRAEQNAVTPAGYVDAIMDVSIS